jgi:hypothetical protein
MAKAELIFIIFGKHGIYIFVVATRYPKGEHILKGAVILIGVDNQRA